MPDVTHSIELRVIIPFFNPSKSILTLHLERNPDSTNGRVRPEKIVIIPDKAAITPEFSGIVLSALPILDNPDSAFRSMPIFL